MDDSYCLKDEIIGLYHNGFYRNLERGSFVVVKRNSLCTINYTLNLNILSDDSVGVLIS